MARAFVAASSQYGTLAAAVVSAMPLTMACWFRSDSDTAIQALMYLGNATGQGQLRLILRGDVGGDPVRAEALDNSGVGTAFPAATTTGYSVNTWGHATAIFENQTDRRVFLNGGNKGTHATSVVKNWTTDTTAVGTRWTSSAAGLFMSGRIAHPAIWSVSLTDAEVAALATGISPTRIRPNALAAYWIIGRSDPEPTVWKGGAALDMVNDPAVADGPPRVGMLWPRRHAITRPAPTAPAAGHGPRLAGARNRLVIA